MIEIEAFVDREQITPAYFEKPYVLVPGKKAEKGYVLLREVLKKTGKVGIGRVVIRTKEYLAMVLPQDDALMLILLRFPQEIVDARANTTSPKAAPRSGKSRRRKWRWRRRCSSRWPSDFNPDDYKDEFKRAPAPR